MRHFCRLFRSDFLSRYFLVDATKAFETFGRDLMTGGLHAGIVSKPLTIYRLGTMPQRHISPSRSLILSRSIMFASVRLLMSPILLSKTPESLETLDGEESSKEDRSERIHLIRR